LKYQNFFFPFSNSGWNVLDFLLVVTSLVDSIMMLAYGDSSKVLGILRVLRLLRALRPLRYFVLVTVIETSTFSTKFAN